jgi:hypothetical protein
MLFASPKLENTGSLTLYGGWSWGVEQSQPAPRSGYVFVSPALQRWEGGKRNWRAP